MEWTAVFDKLVAEKLPELRVLYNEPMAKHTTFRIGGPAARMACPETISQLTALLELWHNERYLILGNGSNMLVSDEGISYPVINTTGLRRIELLEGNILRAECGASLARAAVLAQKNGLAGMTCLHGIPGTVGGAVRMNAGAYGGEISRIVKSVLAWLPERGVVSLTGDELAFSYRHSLFCERDGAVLSADLQLSQGDPRELLREMEELAVRRREKQPLEYPSAGSFFKRPTGHFAGVLIEQCGLKGLTVGGMQISPKHAGFVVNIGGGTCAQTLKLMELVRQKVLTETGVWLEPEVTVTGDK